MNGGAQNKQNFLGRTGEPTITLAMRHNLIWGDPLDGSRLRKEIYNA